MLYAAKWMPKSLFVTLLCSVNTKNSIYNPLMRTHLGPSQGPYFRDCFIYTRCVRDCTQCLHHSGRPYFGGVRKAGFHYIPIQNIFSIMQMVWFETSFNCLLGEKWLACDFHNWPCITAVWLVGRSLICLHNCTNSRHALIVLAIQWVSI